LTGVANQLHVNRFFQGVAADRDLNPLDDSSMPLPPPDAVPDEFTINLADVEHKLSRFKVHK